MEAAFHRRRASEAQLTPSHRQLRQQPKGGTRQFANPPPPSLLHRNRSLKVFFGGDMSVEGLGTLRRALEKDSSSNKQVFSSRLDKGQEGGKDSNRLKQLTGDDYFMGNELGKLGRSSKGHCQFEKGKKKEYLKIGLRANHLESQQPSQNQQKKENVYDPNNYSWRRSLSRSKEHLLSAGVDIGSPQTIQPLESEYYPFQTKNEKRGVQLKDKGMKQIKQVQLNRVELVQLSKLKNMKSGRCKTESKHSRSKSALLRPMVMKHIFEPQTPKVKRQFSGSSKNLLFTFGL